MVASRVQRSDRRTGRRPRCHAPSSGQQKHNTRGSRSGRLTCRVLSVNSRSPTRSDRPGSARCHTLLLRLFPVSRRGRSSRNTRVPQLIKTARTPTRIPLATCARCTACCCCCCCCCTRVCRVCVSCVCRVCVVCVSPPPPLSSLR